MQIVVVKPGESLWSIAQRFGTTVDELVRINGIDDPLHLVPGQAVVVPTRGRVHIVQPGESLWSIARRYNVDMQALIRENRITNPAMIQPGLQLRLPEAPKIIIDVNAFLEPTGSQQDRNIVNEVEEHLTYLSIFSYYVERNGGLIPAQDGVALEALRDSRAVPMLVIANFTEGNFSPEIARAIFTDESAKERLITNVLRIMRERGYQALNIDFENLFPEDRERYNQFLQRITSRVNEAGFLVSTSLAPKQSATQVGSWYEGHDYAAHGRIVNFVVIMTYEWGWSGGPPMAVAPIPQVRKVLDYAVTVIPREKILMGAPLYGYDWTLPYIKGGPFAKVVTPKGAIELARREGVAISYDTTAQAPYFRYYDDEGKEHIVWFEDARSMQAKFDLIKEYRLRGISYWVLGREFPQNWALLEDNFMIRKLR